MTSRESKVGFANLPNQVHRKSVKKGFEFTLMVIGASGLGKSTLINSLFLTDLYADRLLPPSSFFRSHDFSRRHSITKLFYDSVNKTLKIETSTVEIEESGVKLRLTVVDTPGYGDAIDNTNCFKPVIDYIDLQFQKFFHDESGLNRKNITDSRVHCCFYFISPIGHGLKKIDIDFMKALHHKVNIVPVIAKADSFTLKERSQFKSRIKKQLAENNISIYQIPNCESDEDEDFKEETRLLQESIPFAVCGSATNPRSNELSKKTETNKRGRSYPWGFVEVENTLHCDFLLLRNMLITHMQDLQEVTHETHYEAFRCAKLCGTFDFPNDTSAKSSLNSGQSANILKTSKTPAVVPQVDELIKKKDSEIKHMQELIDQMQAQLSQNSQNLSSRPNKPPPPTPSVN